MDQATFFRSPAFVEKGQAISRVFPFKREPGEETRVKQSVVIRGDPSMRLPRNGIAFILIATIVGLASGTFGLIAMIDLVQSRAPERSGESVAGLPLDFELNLQSPFSPFQHDIYTFHNFLLVKDLGICSLVATLTLYAVWRYRRSRNPVPGTATHNTVLETLWTFVPAMTLVTISIPSLRLLREYNLFPPADMTLKVTGHQWYWEYQYPDYGNIDLQSVIVPDDQLGPEEKGKRLLAVDQYAILPTNTTILIRVTGADVIHSFMIPSLGLQKYAVPGRLNEIWTRIEREGVYYGQCNQLCGAGHAFMPIAIRAVSKQRFDAWTDEQKKIASEERERTSPKSVTPPPSTEPVTPPPGAATTPSSRRNVAGSDSIALASLVAQYSPLSRAKEKKMMADLLEGRLRFNYSPKTISVVADSIVCRASNVAILNRACDLKIVKKTTVIKGRKAHELFATLAEIGVPSSGAAGTITRSISHLMCAIELNEIRRNDGTGGNCQFDISTQ